MNREVHFVYILQSLSVDRYYVGETKDVQARLLLHNDDARGTYTSKNGPWDLKRVIALTSRSEGRKVERYIKKRKSKKYIRLLISEDIAVENLLKRIKTSSIG